ncbi:MAG: hypothetical protein A2234_08710 [Elusimicrobia bacterium RIFOXYA2_FULL_58_8]|nr:MAG: hypothetical protein A2285_05030 [Elusimicrobia bacterium RIFOXYA12_FULL_57_11]OGS16914.1 MAG: hypothetical protein A2234_08710 [Elusimicrobia bacterium RIFOXYA2_FULL_58_8]
MKNAAAAILLFAIPLQAAQPAINAISAADISAIEIAVPQVPAPQAPAQDLRAGEVLTRLHLMPQAYKSAISSFVKDDKEFAEFTSMWNPILQKAGFAIGEISFRADIKLAVINYTSPQGLVLRRFMADPLNYDALNPTDMHNLRQELTVSLSKNDMPAAASFYIKSELFRPTFVIYYVTKGGENDDHEKQLRIFKPGDDIDYDLLQKAGVNIVKRDNAFTMVYAGKLIGFKSRVAVDETAAAVKILEFRKYLAENKKEFIGSATHKFATPFVVGAATYNYFFNVYFYQ